MRGFCTDKRWPQRRPELPARADHRKGVSRERSGHHARRSTPAARRASAPRSILEKRVGSSGQIEAALPYVFTQDAGDCGARVRRPRSATSRSCSTATKRVDLQRRRRVHRADRRPGEGHRRRVRSSKPSRRSARRCRATFPCSSTPASSCRSTPTSRPRPGTCAPRSARPSAPAADSAARGRRWWSSSPIAISRAARRPTGTSCPQMQIPMSKRMHILGSVGVRMPVNNTAGRAEAVDVLRAVGLGRRQPQGRVVTRDVQILELRADGRPLLIVVAGRARTSALAAASAADVHESPTWPSARTFRPRTAASPATTA